ncbi:Heme-degrading monooxygenase HmoA [Sphingobium sp. AP50]|uniref:antibiotic biosynthesis monooxygenase family protein n=1 Tax=Sphingobium sp. AP50 TaxID=1884369 RepID=UPI0008C90250|nr:antibiotic biosynthesis monooxygenase family protein [Sphingobium sp. AP50]SEJ98942.1 Heme-degrading monooxygenase HmoA [Sphingobium sp. AP50]
MPQYRSMDPAFPIEKQIGIAAAPVILINLFLLEEQDEDVFLEAWKDDATVMKRQPGFISTQLHRAVGASPAYLNYAIWQSTDHFRAAFHNPEFREKLSAYPSSAVAMPHLFQTVGVDGICVA